MEKSMLARWTLMDIILPRSIHPMKWIKRIFQHRFDWKFEPYFWHILKVKGLLSVPLDFDCACAPKTPAPPPRKLEVCQEAWELQLPALKLRCPFAGWKQKHQLKRVVPCPKQVGHCCHPSTADHLEQAHLVVDLWWLRDTTLPQSFGNRECAPSLLATNECH